MPLTIKSGGNSIVINHVEFDETLNTFLCYENKSEDPIFSHNLNFEIDELPTAAYTEKIYLFKNSFFTGKKILNLKLRDHPGKNKTVGYIFQLEDLINSPEIFDNIYLKKVAFNVFYKLLSAKDISLSPNITTYRQDSNYTLFDFYEETSIIIVVCDQFVSFPNYLFDKYLFSLFKYGFRFMPEYNFLPIESECTVMAVNYNSLNSSLVVEAIENDLHLNYFVTSLLKNNIYFVGNEVARFHLYYQVLEMLMEKVFKNEVKNQLISRIGTLSGYDIKEFFRDSMRDSFALRKLLGQHYSGIENEIIEELTINIQDFLNYIGLAFVEEGLPQAIYKIRNILFHGYSKILENNSFDKEYLSRYLKKINDSLEYLVIDLITTYKDHQPSANTATANVS